MEHKLKKVAFFLQHKCATQAKPNSNTTAKYTKKTLFP